MVRHWRTQGPRGPLHREKGAIGHPPFVPTPLGRTRCQNESYQIVANFHTQRWQSGQTIERLQADLFGHRITTDTRPASVMLLYQSNLSSASSMSAGARPQLHRADDLPDYLVCSSSARYTDARPILSVLAMADGPTPLCLSALTCDTSTLGLRPL
jgi:hypothetical protein